MSKGKKEKVIHVDNLVIHAKNVEFIRDRDRDRDRDDRRNRDPWGFFWGRPLSEEDDRSDRDESSS